MALHVTEDLVYYKYRLSETGEEGCRMGYRPLPIGVDNFEDMRRNRYYYLDKTWMLKELWDEYDVPEG